MILLYGKCYEGVVFCYLFFFKLLEDCGGIFFWYNGVVWFSVFFMFVYLEWEYDIVYCVVG